MAYKRTGRPVGRPKTKDYMSFALKMPTDLFNRVKSYARIHQQSIAELIRDGLEWRITDGDPRGYTTLHSGNTEIPSANGATAPAPTAVSEAATPATPSFDTVKHRLGKLCKRGHDWENTGKSLRHNNKVGNCLACDAETAREKRQQEKVNARNGAAAKKRPRKTPVTARSAAG